MSRPFIDVVDIVVNGGNGGDGCKSFKSEPYNPHGGPDGGNGGTGGDVVIEADNNVSTLTELNYERVIEAEDGENGGPKKQQGGDGDPTIVHVPEGTVIYDENTGEQLSELVEDGQEMTVAHGGDGGRGNRCFVNSQRQSPKFREFGETGESRQIRLELKLLADAGLVGRPNAGKSTLLDALTGAHPEVADYEFTTKTPNLGVLFRDYERLTLCDIPGLIENAHEGAGLGFEFLRHVDRTKILIHVVDLSAPNPVQKYEAVREEIQSYDPEMLDKPTLVALNKVDRVDEDMVDLFLDEVNEDDSFIPISATAGTNLDRLRTEIWSLYETLPDEQADDEDDESVDRVVKMEQETPISVTELNGRYLLRGKRVEELVERFNLSNPDALAYVRDQLLSLDLHKILERAGCRPGDTVQVGRQEFEYTG